uniref:Uncharacterized protein n=1 Tax=Anopheles atroparvus TaxID=41427 RepID=A0A182IXE5_ANOAO
MIAQDNNGTAMSMSAWSFVWPFASVAGPGAQVPGLGVLAVYSEPQMAQRPSASKGDIRCGRRDGPTGAGRLLLAGDTASTMRPCPPTLVLGAAGECSTVRSVQWCIHEYGNGFYGRLEFPGGI